MWFYGLKYTKKCFFHMKQIVKFTIFKRIYDHDG